MKPTELSNSDFEMQVRKSYIKPRIERVRLVPEETVLGGCKTPGFEINQELETSGCRILDTSPCFNDGS